MPDVVQLVLGGRALEAWTSVRVTRSIESGAGVFELAASERHPGSPTARLIRPGEACAIRIDGEVLITGYVDEVEVTLEGSSHLISVRGRDAVADLIDCAPDVDPAEWANVDLLKLATELAKPFRINVRADVDIGPPLQRVALSAGQRAWDLIEQAARFAKVLPISDGKGGLVFTRAGRARLASAIVEGENLLRARASYSDADRFSEYIVKGDSPDYDGLLGAKAGRAVGRAPDKLVTRHRPLLLVSDQAVDDAKCTARAQWESLTRAARAARAEVEVQGWRQASGALWPLNALVPLHSPSLGLSGEFLIASVTFTLDESGSITALQLMRPDAFTTAPAPEPKRVGFDALSQAIAAVQEEQGEGADSEDD